MGNPPDTFAAILDALHEDCRKRIAALEAEVEEATGREGELQMRGNEWARRANSLAADNATLKRNVLRKHKALEKTERLLTEWNHRAPSKRSAGALRAARTALAPEGS